MLQAVKLSWMVVVSSIRAEYRQNAKTCASIFTFGGLDALVSLVIYARTRVSSMELFMVKGSLLSIDTRWTKATTRACVHAWVTFKAGWFRRLTKNAQVPFRD
jgi:hypothetical protein